MQQLLLLEVVLKGAAGILLILMPLSALKLFGLHRPTERFWPRLAGFLLLGISAGTLVTMASPDSHGGIGPAGLICINFAGAAGLIAPLIWGTAAPERRGRFLLSLTTFTLLALGFIEIAHV